MEICARALSFWTYQATQEIVYQEYMSKTLQDKYNEVNTQMDNIIREANAEIGNLRDKIAALQNEQQAMVRKNHEITESLQAKNRQYNKLQALYDQIKRKSLISPIQNGVAANIDAAFASSTTQPAQSSVANTASNFSDRAHDWRHSQMPPSSNGKRIMLDTSKNANITRRPPLEALHTVSNQANFMSTPRNNHRKSVVANHSIRGSSVARSSFQGRGF